jgi:hypothetical protein
VRTRTETPAPARSTTAGRRWPGRSATWAALALVASLLCTAAGASANHALLEVASVGPTGGNAEVDAYFKAVSQNGGRMLFETNESLVSSDTDGGYLDVYERSGAATTLVSTPGKGPFAASYAGSTPDGSRVFFQTSEQLVAGDTDASRDVYQRSGGTTTLVSTGPAGGNGTPAATFNSVSDDGARVFFQTTERLVSSDTDTTRDIYQRSAGITTLVSTGSSGGNGSFHALFKAISSDGSKVFFETQEALTADDTDTQTDVYQRAAGTTTRISTGPSGGNGTIDRLSDAFFGGASLDGTRVFFTTDEALTGDDVDEWADVYERNGSTTTLLSTGPAGGNGDFDADFRGSSDDGAHVFMQTDEPLVATDLDALSDVYDRSGGATTLVSTGPLAGIDLFSASFAGAAADGDPVFFTTPVTLTSDDTDNGWRDVYQRSNGVTTLVSTGPGAGGDFNAYLNFNSADGSRVFFYTDEPLVSGDSDAVTDIYERFGGTTSQLSTGPDGGDGPFFSSFAGASDDGSTAFFHTAEALRSNDLDGTQDVYAAGQPSATGYARPKGATPMLVSLVPAFAACQTPNRTHGAPLASPSCNPPAQSSPNVTVGSPDANGKPANSSASARLDVIAGNASTTADEADVKVTLNVTDVRSKADLTDYAGELQAQLGVEIVDKDPASAASFAIGTAQVPLLFTVPCTGTPTVDTIGSTCSLNSTVDSLVPGAVKELKRAIWQLGQVQVNDGGADGLAATPDNSAFLREGIFVP